MKVLHVITQLDDAGGAEKLLQDLLPELQARGVEVDCAVIYGHDSQNMRSLESHGIHVFELGYDKHYYNLFKVFKLLRYTRSYDIIHAHNTPAVVLVALANVFRKRKIVMTLHSTVDRLRDKKITKWFDTIMQNHYDSIICCSLAAEDALRSSMSLPHPIIKTVNNGVELKRFLEASPQKEMSGMPCKKITMVAWFREPKEHKNVIDAMAYLPEHYHLFLVGDGGMKEGCIQYARDKGLGERVHFLGLRNDVPQILKASDFVVLASHYEGLSLSTIEGMAAGKPFVASDVPGIREVVEGAGCLFPEGGAKALADTILALANDKRKYDETAMRCQQRAMNYDMSTMADGYKEIYDKLMGEGSSQKQISYDKKRKGVGNSQRNSRVKER